jgi:exosome complex protein LRP1
MDPQTDLPDLVEDLEVNIDELSTVLAPLLDAQLSTTASSLPLLDKAKLYVLAAYSIESLLYSTLQASGVNAKEHAIFKELARLKGYFGKIKSIEERTITAPAAAPKSKLDVGAAARFIKHGLAGNDKYDLERAERMAKERARAQLKARQINKKFDDEGKAHPKESTPKKRDIEEVVAAEPAQSNDDSDAILHGLDDDLESPSGSSPPASEPPIKKPKIADVETMDVDSPAPSPAASNAQKQPRKSKRSKNKPASASKSTENSDVDVEPSQSSEAPTSASTRPKRKQRGKKGANKSSADEADAAKDEPVAEEKPKRGRGRPRGSGKGK